MLFKITLGISQWISREKIALFAALAVISVLYITQALIFTSEVGEFNSEGSSSGLPYLVLYNRPAKTGGTAMTVLLQKLKRINHFKHKYSDVGGKEKILTPSNEISWISDIEHFLTRGPHVLQGHFSYISFEKYGTNIRPVYINMIRDPLERLVSFYYFVRFGDDMHLSGKRWPMRNPLLTNMTFDECVQNEQSDCSTENLWNQVPLFCGASAYCRIPGNPEALATAKRRVTEDYLFVGLSEYFNETVEILEILLPRIFRGASSILKNKKTLRIRNTVHKSPVSEETKRIFRLDPIWQAEQNFYNFVRTEFRAKLDLIKRNQTYRYLDS